jgi:malonate-semialdehyde dehydrogenase (acetylating)/methylmalonate-semialdehyde dehydrogenase
MRRLGHWIEGREVEGAARRTGDVFDPATGTKTAEVALASAAEVDAAVRSAAAAFPAWAATTPLMRARVLFRLRDLMERRRDDLAAAITAEHGKTLDDARGEVTRGLEVVEFACGIPNLLKGDHTPDVGRGIDSHSQRAPLGVVAGITPFNFPVMVPCWMAPIAIACGNAIVLKPSEKTPGATLLLASLAAEAGLPPGILSVVNGDAEAVDALLLHREVRAVSFVGSTPVGEHVYRTAAAHGKRVQALCGAKNHMVVMPDADLDAAADALVGAAYGSAGERCMAVSVCVAVGDVADALLDRVAARTRALRVGPGADPASQMGPLVTAAHLARVRGFLDAGVAEGARLVVDGRGLRVPGHERGFFLGPCILDRVTPAMSVWREEIFGPVLCVCRVPDLDAALAMANSHEFGNGAAVFTRDGGAARAFVQRIDAGMVGVNVPIPVPMAFHSFGGWKRSLLGDRDVHGTDGVGFFTRLKTTTVRWPDAPARGVDTVMPTLK